MIRRAFYAALCWLLAPLDRAMASLVDDEEDQW